MKREDIERALAQLDDDLIEEYVSRPEKNMKRTKIPFRIALVAALTAMLLILPFSIFIMSRGGFGLPDGYFTGVSSDSADPSATDAVTDDPADTGFNGEIRPPEPLPMLDIKQVSALKPLSDGVVESNTAFSVEVENASLEQVKKSIAITPAVDYMVKQVSTKEYLIVPSTTLEDNTIYKISSVSNGTVIDSWAFQTPDVLSITGTYPANGVNNASVNTAVEISLSYTSVSHLSDFVSFEPHVEGSWSQLGKTWRFIPNDPLYVNTQYTVTVASGISAEGQTIDEEYSFTFGTFEGESVDGVILDAEYISTDRINTYRPLDRITMLFTSASNVDLVKEASSFAEIYRYSDAEDFLKAASGGNVAGESYGSFNVECTFGSKIGNHRGYYLLSLDTSLPVGYYKAEICTDSGRVIGEWFIQVSNMSLYAAQSSYEMLLWTADDEGIRGGIEVTVGSEEYVTDEKGILKLDLKELIPFEDKYVFVNDPDNEIPMIIGFDSLDTAYPEGYIYTDKIYYRSDDTVNIWGYVPPVAVPETSDGIYEVVIGNTIVIPVTPDENGTFAVSYKLDNFEVNYYSVAIRLDGHILCSISFYVADYVNDYYSYELILPRNCIYPGETMEFEVKVTHISGIPAVNKAVRLYESYSKEYYAVTDENGIARFTITIDALSESQAEKYAVTQKNIVVYSGDSYESVNEVQDTEIIYVIMSDRHIESELTDDGIEYTVREVVIPDSGFVENANDLYGDTIDCDLQVDVALITRIRNILEYRFDEYLKENIPVYGTKEMANDFKSFTAQTEGGKFVFNERLEKKANTENESYFFEVKVTAIEADGITPYEISNYMMELKNHTSGLYGSISGFIDHSDYYAPYAYRSYRYKLSCAEDYNIHMGVGVGDSIPLIFKEFGGENIEGGVLMAVIMQNGIKETVILDPAAPESIVFTEDMIPGVKVEAVYYKDGVFNRVMGFEVNFNANTRDLQPEISYDKDEYAPGDEMTVTVTVTDNNGNTVPNLSINLSIVDSSAGDLYNPNLNYTIGQCDYESYTFSSFHDYSVFGNDGGGYGGGGGGRSNFAEVALFASGVTDDNGRVQFTFTLPDSVTEYTVTLHGADAELHTVTERSTFKVGLDFFIQYSSSLDVKTTDDTVITAVAANKENIAVHFNFILKEIDQVVAIESFSNRAVSANFGKLPAGVYTVRIEAEANGFSDAVEYPLEVIETALSFPVDTELKVYSEETIIPETNPVTFRIHVAAYERYMRYFEFLISDEDRRDISPLVNAAKKLRYELCGAPYADTAISYTYIYDDTSFMKASELHEGDPVLTALLIYFAPKYSEKYIENHKVFLDTMLLSEFENASDAAEKLLIAAALGKPVFSELCNMALAVDEEDNYTRLILSLAFIFCGDYENAREMYMTSVEDYGDTGYDALRAIAATFVDREFAGDMIDVLVDTTPHMMYLRFATLSYIKNRCDLAATPRSITIYYGTKSETVTINGLEDKYVTLIMDEPTEIYFEPHTFGIKVFSHHIAGKEYLENAEKKINTWLEGDISENGRAYLVIDLSAYDEHTGELSIVIPDALGFTVGNNLPLNYYLYENIVTNRITVTKSITKSMAEQQGKEYTSVLRIPLSVKHLGDFVVEEAVFTSITDESIGVSETISYTNQRKVQ